MLVADEVLEADEEAELAVELVDAVLAPELQPASVALTSRAAAEMMATSRFSALNFRTSRWISPIETAMKIDIFVERDEINF